MYVPGRTVHPARPLSRRLIDVGHWLGYRVFGAAYIVTVACIVILVAGAFGIASLFYKPNPNHWVRDYQPSVPD